MKITEFVFGDGTTYKDKGDRCSCLCHFSDHYDSACRLCMDELWPGDLCYFENHYESDMKSIKRLKSIQELQDLRFNVNNEKSEVDVRSWLDDGPIRFSNSHNEIVRKIKQIREHCNYFI